MLTAILPINYPALETVDDPWWLRFAQPELVDDIATVGETADLLDALYAIDPCDGSDTAAAPTSAEDVAEAATSTFDLAICGQDFDGSITLPIRLYRSHPAEP